jgi:hypothetical protein
MRIKTDGRTRRETKYIRDLKADINRKVAKDMRERREKAFTEVMEKESVKTYGDIFAILAGLSRGAKDLAVFKRIEYLASLNYSPKKIVEIMELKK